MKVSEIAPLTKLGSLHPSAFILPPSSFPFMSRPTPRSFLTYRAVKRAPVADGDAFDDVGATPALLAVAVIDAQMVLKFAALVVGVAVVRKRRAAPADRVAKQSGNGSSDRLNLFSRQ